MSDGTFGVGHQSVDTHMYLTRKCVSAFQLGAACASLHARARSCARSHVSVHAREACFVCIVHVHVHALVPTRAHMCALPASP